MEQKYLNFKNYLHLGGSLFKHEPSEHVFDVPIDDVRSVYEVSFEERFEGQEYVNSALIIAKNSGDIVAVTSVFRVWTNEFPRTELVKGYESNLFTFEGVGIRTLVDVCTDESQCLAILSNDEIGENARLVVVRLDGKSRPVTVFKGLEL